MTKSKETSRKREPKTSETTVDGLFGRLDPVLVVSALSLIAIGLWAVASSSTAFSVKHYGDPHYVFYKQLVGLCIGSVAAYVAYRVPTDFWYRRAGWFFVILLIACLLVLIPGIGIKGRWCKTVVRFSWPAGSAFRVYEASRALLCICAFGKRTEEADWNDEGSHFACSNCSTWCRSCRH